MLEIQQNIKQINKLLRGIRIEIKEGGEMLPYPRGGSRDE